MTGISTKKAADLLQKGAFSTARAVRDTGDTWRLSLVPKVGTLTYDLQKYRSNSARVFRSLDATVSAAQVIGFSTVEVQL
jgi:hypothetical protein